MSINDNKIPMYDFFPHEDEERTNLSHINFKHTIDKQIYKFLVKCGNTGKTREQICKELNLPRSSVFDALTRLNIIKLIETDFKIKSKSRKGRPSTIYFVKHIPQGKNR